MSTLYNTYVISTDRGFNAVKLVGQLEPLDKALSIESGSYARYNGIDFFVQSYEVGSERDLECQRDLKKLAKKQNAR